MKLKKVLILSIFSLFLFTVVVLMNVNINKNLAINNINQNNENRLKTSSYTHISAEEAYNMINNSTLYPDLLVLDVRTQGEYDTNHICNATLIPHTELESRISELDPYKDTEIIVYCGSGVRSITACEILDSYDFTKVFNMMGGLAAWIGEGYEVCTDDLDPPIWGEAPTDQPLEYGEAFNYDLNAFDPSGLDDWWLNDTTYFDIDGNGVITNKSLVPIGEYWLEVNVNDTYGNTLTGKFKITVEDTTPPSWAPEPTDRYIDFGDAFNYDLNATDLSGIGSWELNDTTYFDIDGNGVITNITSINVGIYWLEVRVNDTFDNQRTKAFRVIVQDIDVPIWVQIPSDQPLEYGEAFNYDLNASDPSSLDDWWLNDTTYFDIDGNGVITNIILVPIGEYWLEVSVNDTYGNTLMGKFKITVEDATSPSWVQIPSDQPLEYGETFNYDLNATDLSGIGSWELNDTTYFDIDGNGVITNKSLVPIGEYWLEVNITDTYGNTLTGKFKITVEDTTPPSWAPEPTDRYIDFGNGLNYDLNATDLSGIGSWELNDTTYFDVDANGVITNITSINVGIYWLEVRVNDTFDNQRTKAFRVIVQDIDVPIWIQIPSDKTMEFGSYFNYDLNASDTSGIHDWWLNDTTYFDIDGNGVITNKGLVPVGIYWLETRAYDPYSQYCFAEFRITVEDTIAPTWDEIPKDQSLEYGKEFNYDLNASDASGINHWWVNDTNNFAIDNITGLITNINLLEVGVYSLEVRAYDPHGHYCTSTFKITITKPKITQDYFWLITIIGSSLGIAIIALITIKIIKKRKL